MMTDIVVLRNGYTFWIHTRFLDNAKQITYARLLQSCLANRICFAVGKQQLIMLKVQMTLHTKSLGDPSGEGKSAFFIFFLKISIKTFPMQH